MRELISNPGIQFYILKLEGTLSYSVSINSKKPKIFQLSDTDFEDLNPQAKEEDSKNITSHAVSTVGVELQLIKNDGVLTIDFESWDGNKKSWICHGLKVCGVAGTQTEEVVVKVPITRDMDTQTDDIVFEDVEMKVEEMKVAEAQAAEETTQREIDVQTDLILPKDAELINAKYKKPDGSIWYWHPTATGGQSIPEDEEHSNLGLVTIKNQQKAQPGRKRARTQSSYQTYSGLPRHIYMTGDEALGYNPGPGRLHIDLETEKMFFEKYHEKNFIRDNNYKVLFINGQLRIIHVCKTGKVLRWKSTHANKPRPYGNNNGSWDKDSSVTIEDFVQAIRVCLRPRAPVAAQQVITQILPTEVSATATPKNNITMADTSDNQSNKVPGSTVDHSSLVETEELTMTDAKDKDCETIDSSQVPAQRTTGQVPLPNNAVQVLETTTEPTSTLSNELNLIADFGKKLRHYAQLKISNGGFLTFREDMMLMIIQAREQSRRDTAWAALGNDAIEMLQRKVLDKEV